MSILVIGESCRDVFCYGRADRLCPEAPAPVFNPVDYQENDGMAKNVQNNIIALGEQCDLLTNNNWREIIKTRYVHKATNQLFLRVDEGDNKVSKIDLKFINFDDYEIVVISDYCKGFLSCEDIQFIASMHHCVFLDTKKDLGDWCSKISFIKINNIEYERTKAFITKEMKKKMIITLGANGCQYQEESFPVSKVEIKDVSGAGDTFLAGLVVDYLRHGDIKKAAIFANLCATEVVQKRGVNACR